MITQERLKELVHYDPLTGVFTSISNRQQVKIGDKLGHTIANGYLGFKIYDGRRYYSHKLAWLYIYGVYPEHIVDHINNNRKDNRIANLRKASRSQNNANRVKNKKHGLPKGVTWNKRSNKYVAQMNFKCKKVYLGRYNSAEEAHEAYCKAAKELHGEFARTE